MTRTAPRVSSIQKFPYLYCSHHQRDAPHTPVTSTPKARRTHPAAIRARPGGLGFLVSAIDVPRRQNMHRVYRQPATLPTLALKAAEGRCAGQKLKAMMG